MNKFKHSGHLGDIVYALPAIKAMLDRNNDGAATLYIPNDAIVDNPGLDHPGGKFMLNQALFDFIEPLLASQPFIKKVDFLPSANIPASVINLDSFREGKINIAAGNIKDYYCKIFGLPSGDASPWLECPTTDRGTTGIVVGRSTRYLNQSIDYSILSDFSPEIYFLGSDREYIEFSKKYKIKGLQRAEVMNALDACHLIASSRLYIGNQSLFFAIAEGLKTDRILETYEPVPNVIPQGGRCGQFISTRGMAKLITQLTGTPTNEKKYLDSTAVYVLSQPSTDKAHLYQIAYSEETLSTVPKSFLPLDNRTNERPDWAEYWPIRRFLMRESLDEDTFYGFLSPRFSEKLGATGEELSAFVSGLSNDIDIATFSPYFDYCALFHNVFEAGEFFHPGFMDLAQKILREIQLEIDIHRLVNSSKNTIFCNYFAAKPRFWREWLEICERIYEIAESPEHPLAATLNRGYFHRDNAVPAKVFLIERIASLLLTISPNFKTAQFRTRVSLGLFKDLPYSLLSSLDDLKLLATHGNPGLLDAYSHIQREIMHAEPAKSIRNACISNNQEFGLGHVPSRGYEQTERKVPDSNDALHKVGISWFFRNLLGRR